MQCIEKKQNNNNNNKTKTRNTNIYHTYNMEQKICSNGRAIESKQSKGCTKTSLSAFFFLLLLFFANHKTVYFQPQSCWLLPIGLLHSKLK